MREKHFDFYHRESGKVVRVTIVDGKCRTDDFGLMQQLRLGWWTSSALQRHMRDLGFAEVAKDD